MEPITGMRRRAFRELADAMPEPSPPTACEVPSLNDGNRANVMAALGPQPADLDEIARSCGMDVRNVRIIVMELDPAGRIERHGRQLVSLLPAEPA